MTMDKRGLFGTASQRGAAMMELLLSLALVAVMLPFIVRWERTRVERSENMAVARNINVVRDALERYMDAHRKEYLATVSQNIVRVRIRDLAGYGLTPEFIVRHADDFQLRILKTADVGGTSVLQGMVIMNSEEYTPMRTRELVMLSGENAGFIDGATVYGAYGTYSTSTGAIGAGGYNNSIASGTRSIRSGDEYIWRVPSDDATDATLASNLNMGGHNIQDVHYLDSRTAQFEDSLIASEIAAEKIIWATRPELSGNIEVTGQTVIDGILSADARNLELSGDLTLDDTARFNNITANELWADNMHLAGLSISGDSGKPAVLKVNQSIDMTGGRVNAIFVTVGFTGSLTPRLVVSGYIQDPADASYFWNVADGIASLSDISMPTLNAVMRGVAAGEGAGTEAYRTMYPVSANANATVADFMRALADIEKRVRAKYLNLNLEI